MSIRAGLTVLAAAAAVAACPASAQLMTYNVSGVFTDGKTLSGAFTVDPTKVNADQYSNVNIAVSGIGYLPNVVSSGFDQPAVGTGPVTIGGFLQGGNNSSTLQVGFTGNHAGFQLYSIPDGPLLTAYTKYMNNGATVFLSSGTISRVGAAVPEPSVWAMMIVGLASVGYAMRRRPSTAVKVFCAP